MNAVATVERKDRKFGDPTMLFYRDVYAVVPRPARDTYWHMPWSEVLRAAEQGRDGLEVFKRVDDGHGFKPLPSANVPDVCYLTEGQGDFVGKTVLFRQNW